MELPVNVAVVLLPPCSSLGIGCLAEPFSLANRLTGKKLYDVKYYSWDGEPVALAGGLAFPVHGALRDGAACEQLFVLSEGIGGFAEAVFLQGTLARLSQRVSLMGGVHAGAWWLAAAGVLDGYRATIHWQENAQFAERFRKVIVSQHVFEIDRDRFSSGGGLAVLDGVLSLIGRRHGATLAEAIAEALCAERIRASNERQRVPLANRLGERQPKLTEAVMLMEANIEEPLTTDEIARFTGQSRRHLERLFKQYLDIAPSRYYLQLRLEKARTLLQRTNKSVAQIGLSCGFSSGPHFSTVYRSHFGMAPREERLLAEMSGGEKP
ncbi:GlxA family transcriptional regulator [Crenobacter cavernae]|uniref:GlxA family transcriptional regulator n=1 Tax=Crenobacter cavernae TaxID=2290923 RepID=A0ABY0FIS3_9NEIS|nr:GlxA family transcriptional regulator [Crenobacter cavernae]RXZ45626.1 GlxA family transcriptional regulator [Crenobacter cavernae]